MKKIWKVIDFPFKNNWYELVTKRLIRYAADNNLMLLLYQKERLLVSKQITDRVINKFQPKLAEGGTDPFFT